MNLDSKKTSRIILGITALVCSRILFLLFDDPEGPNLLIVVAMAVIIYALSSIIGRHTVRATGLKKLLLTILIQILLVVGFYFLLR